MKALIVSPYLDHLGGGERYMLTIASVLETLGYTTTFAWDNQEQIRHLASLLGITLRDPRIDPSIKPLYFSHNFFSWFQATRPYDVVVYLSDGSIPVLGGKNNILHFQVPFHGVGGRRLTNQLKLKNISNFIVNSRFTKTIVDQEYGIYSTVLYPPVPILKSGVKSNTILSVGRFEPSLNVKQQNILIDAFHIISPQLPDWKLILAGGCSSDEYLTKLRSQAGDLPIEFHVNSSYDNLCQLYAKSRIYWHAAGYGVDEQSSPELTEHFGISTVEAISAGAIPLVVPYGGQKEIVTDPQLHWTTIDELVNKTLLRVHQAQPISIDISAYSAASFAQSLRSLL